MAPAPCKFFSLGICSRGKECQFLHEAPPSRNGAPPSRNGAPPSRNGAPGQSQTSSPLKCRFFALGHCRDGDNCAFSHEVTKSSNASRHDPSPATKSVPYPSASEQDERVSGDRTAELKRMLKTWGRAIPSTPQLISKARPLGGTGLASFFKQALLLVTSGGENMQATMTQLASEGGLGRIKKLVHQDFKKFPEEKLEDVWKTQLLPLLQLLSHPEVLRSLVVETHHATLVSFIYGLEGRSAIQIFWCANHCTRKHSSEESTVETCVAVLFEILGKSSLAKLNQDLKAVSEELISLSETAPRSRSLERHLLAIRTALDLDIPDMEIRPPRTTGEIRPAFTMAQDMPGDLSEDGARHDNDSTDITEIRILPTKEEIQSSRPEYLPRDDPSEWHLSGIPGLLDRQFRLIREDTVGQLRDAVKFELRRLQNPPELKRQTKERHGARTNTYRNIKFEHAVQDEQNGMLFVLSFEQPSVIKEESNKTRKAYWDESNRLAPGSLICLLSANGEATFLAVHMPADGRKYSSSQGLDRRFSLMGTKQVGYVIAHLTTLESQEVSAFVKRCTATRSSETHHSLIEFPGVILPAFEPTLVALQQMAQSLDVPFADSLLPGPATHSRPPLYASAPGFKWDLSGLVHSGSAGPLNDKEPKEILQHSTLDDAQQRAVLHAFNNELALIQGPPGTGKSYTGVKLIQTLLENKEQADLGPLLVVTYTNHALDQLLEHLIDAGVEQVIRIGSRSKSERLEPINLKTVARGYGKTRFEGKKLTDANHDIGTAIAGVAEHLETIRSVLTKDGTAIAVYLKSRHPAFHARLFGGKDSEGFQTVHHKGVPPLLGWLQGHPIAATHGEDRELRELESGALDLFEMSPSERQILYQSWVKDIHQDAYEELEMQLDDYKDSKAKVDALRGEVDLRILSKASVIGITTSGLARSVKHLTKLGSKVLVVEEAGEVLEGHLLTAMLPSLEHAIMIGDHQQLRPKVVNYDLSVDNPYSNITLDVSLFERMVTSAGLPLATLETQRRMHPSISRLVRKTLYPKLQDAESVKNHPDVVGMRHRLFWLDHNRTEDSESDQVLSTTHTNTHEVEMVAALVNHLVGQGVYRAEDIAVLTPYLGQLRKLRRKLDGLFTIVLDDRDVEDLDRDGEDDLYSDDDTDSASNAPKKVKTTLLQNLRLATVDNFQGEEAKVVIISLVRSNDQKNCGFLRTSNRINVLLSRAKDGMYIIGNSNTCESIDMWSEVLKIFRASGNIGNSLELCCPRHPDTPLMITEPEDFAHVSPEAGCNLPCNLDLDCGHRCPHRCHSEALHSIADCMEECGKAKQGCKHPCKNPCGSPCEKQCPTIVKDIDVELDCGHHVTSLPCWQYQNPSRAYCKELVQRTAPGCGHIVSQACNDSLGRNNFQCHEVCSTSLPCGHSCSKECYICRRRVAGKVLNVEADHGYCQDTCGRDYETCPHSCSSPCHGEKPCPPCPNICEVSCKHADCSSKQCSDVCTPCTASCLSHCPHSEACQMPCSAPCDWVPCNERCQKLIACGHQCSSMCGELCNSPDLCHTCASETVREMCVDPDTLLKYGEIKNLDATPCIALECGHIFTVQALDRILGFVDQSQTDGAEPFTSKILPLSYDKAKACPNCRESLRGVSRYGCIVRRSILDNNIKKLVIASNKEYAALADWLMSEQARLADSITTADLAQAKSSRYESIRKMKNAAWEFFDKTSNEEQPFQHVRELVEAVRRDGRSEAASFDCEHMILQIRAQLLATALLLRSELAIARDRVSIWEKMPVTRKRLTLNSTKITKVRGQCEALYKSAEQSKHVLQQVESLVLWAQLAGLECIASTEEDSDRLKVLHALEDNAHLKLDEAESICKEFGEQTKTVVGEVSAVRQMLDEHTCSVDLPLTCTTVPTDFGSNCRWFCCVNGHPFTSDECGGPIELCKCPRCGERIVG